MAVAHLASMDPEVSVRRATAEDATAICQVHVRSWQWAYRGLLPDELLSGMSKSLDRRIAARRANLEAEPADQRTWIAEQDGRAVGFAITSTSRDDDANAETGQVEAIYLAPAVVGTGVGRTLFRHSVDDLRQRGYQQATLWVLAGNQRGRLFYEAAGWRPDGAAKTEERLGATLDEVRYRIDLR